MQFSGFGSSDIINAAVARYVSAGPGYFGGHDWQATAYSQETSAIIIPLHEACMEMAASAVELALGRGGFGAAGVLAFEMPGSKGKLGKLAAL